MKPLALIASLAAFPAFAGERITVYHDPSPGDNWFARIVITNVSGSETRVHEVNTTRGIVAVRYITTKNELGPGGYIQCCDDNFAIIELPDGVIPDIWEGDVAEEASETIYLREWMGG